MHDFKNVKGFLEKSAKNDCFMILTKICSFCELTRISIPNPLFLWKEWITL